MSNTQFWYNSVKYFILFCIYNILSLYNLCKIRIWSKKECYDEKWHQFEFFFNNTDEVKGGMSEKDESYWLSKKWQYGILQNSFCCMLDIFFQIIEHVKKSDKLFN